MPVWGPQLLAKQSKAHKTFRNSPFAAPLVFDGQQIDVILDTGSFVTNTLAEGGSYSCASPLRCYKPDTTTPNKVFNRNIPASISSIGESFGTRPTPVLTVNGVKFPKPFPVVCWFFNVCVARVVVSLMLCVGVIICCSICVVVSEFMCT